MTSQGDWFAAASQGSRAPIVAVCLVSLLMVGMLLWSNHVHSKHRLPTTKVNIAQDADLSLTQALEIRQFQASTTPITKQTAFVPKAVIRDQDAIDRFVGALDEETEVSAVVPACTPNYQVVFHRSDDVVVTFGYLCSSSTSDFVPSGTSASDGSFAIGGAARVPDRFRKLLEAELQKMP